MTELGVRLNTTKPRIHKACGQTAVLDVFENAVRWRCCGHVHELPPLHPFDGGQRQCRICAEKRKTEAVAA